MVIRIIPGERYAPVMSVHVVRLGTERLPGEGLRLGTVRRPPRGVPRDRFASDDWYDVWLPQLAPSAELVKEAQAAKATESETGWKAFERAYRSEMAAADNARLIALLAALSRTSSFSVGCYCEDEARCHRSILRELLADAGADLAGG
jgi:uncharacterized protein YeaO (DUF488 family)